MNIEKEEREIRNIVLIAIPVAIMAAIALILYFAQHFDQWMR